MRRPLLYLIPILLVVRVAAASDIFQRTRPDWPSQYPISGAVQVSNFPSTQPVTVTNLPAVQPVSGTVAISNQLQVQISTVGVNNPGLSFFSNVSLSTTPVQIKASSCDIWAFYVYNNATAGNERSVKMYNRLSPPVLGTTPADLTFTVGGRSGLPMNLPEHFTFQNGLWIIATTASGTSGITAPLAGEVSVNFFYK